MGRLAAIDFRRWIDEHRHLLKPPVGNAQVFQDADFIVMVVGGPNARKDYHVNEGEELFYQVEGDMVLKVIDGKDFYDIPIPEGGMFLLPARMPHSPQRRAGTVGLVVERKRAPGELDAFLWHCDGCKGLIYKEELPVTDIVAQLKALMERFWASEAQRTCKACGQVLAKPTPFGERPSQGKG